MRQLNDYIKDKRLELSASIQHRTVVYLDTKYWIILRNQNRKDNLGDKQLLSIVIDLFESGKCIFPISEITFWEVLKQQDKTTRKETISLIDKLSEGISIISTDERIQLEFTHFFRKNSGKEVFELKELVWSKLPLILSYKFLSTIKSEVDQKSFFESVSGMSLTEMLRIIEVNNEIQPFIFKDNVLELNQNKTKFELENITFQALFLSELSGYLDHYQNALNEAMCWMFYRETGKFPSEAESREVSSESLRTMILNGFKLGKITAELPVLRIVPELFAAVRWDKGRKFKDGNDTMDFLHVSFALPYCSYFFTENELHSLIVKQKLDSLYDCKVESNPSKVLEILNSIKL